MSGSVEAVMGSEAVTVRALAAELASITTRPWTLMEVCGGQTHAILRWGLDQLLPAGVRLIHGPGCPVCVTPAATIDAALALARQGGVILASYGDMLRVPGSVPGDDLLDVRAAGGQVRLLTSPLQAIALAQDNPRQQVVFLAVGFETTAPATALLARQARDLGLANLSILTAHVRVAPAMAAILEEEGRVQGFLAAGHVAAVVGTGELQELADRHGVPVVVSGFAPADLLRGVLACVHRLEAGRPGLENAYRQVVRPAGNPAARSLLAEVFTVVDRPWRGLGVIPGGGLDLAPGYSPLDARRRFGLSADADGRSEPPELPGPCIAGRILQGRATPDLCPAFGRACTPDHPLGPPMVSSEGACAAWYRYGAAGTTPGSP